MYISSGLFHGQRSPSEHRGTLTAPDIQSSSTSMLNSLGKRKRMADGDVLALGNSFEVLPKHNRLHSPSHNNNVHLSQHFNGSLASKEGVPAPDHAQHHLSTLLYLSGVPSYLSTSTTRSTEGLPPPKSRRRMMPLRSNRIPTISPNHNQSNPQSHPGQQAILTPCHICHSRPKQKKDLDSYTDCSKCIERTCYICLRQCECGKKICSGCCVEEGEEGVVSCLDCLRAQEQKGGIEQVREWEMTG